VEVGSEKYDAIANSNIIKSLQNAFGVEDLSKADLSAEAKEYIASLGLTEAEIAALMNNLGADAELTPPTGDTVMKMVAVMLVALAGTVALVHKRKEI
jgi:hypothetical protein